VGCGFEPAARLGSKMGRDVHEYVHQSVDLGFRKTVELISVAYAPGTRRHIKAAFRSAETVRCPGGTGIQSRRTDSREGTSCSI
jgi:hypothetical protein